MAMRGYDRDEYEDLDEYEDEEEAEGAEEEEVDEYEEEADRQPTEEESQYLELRERLKEQIRKQMKKDPGSSLSNARDKKNKMPYDKFGSFFGPSQPVIAQRVIQESKLLLENPHLTARASKSNHSNKKGLASTPTASKPRAADQSPKVINVLKEKSKVQMLKNTRDYSFLSDDSEIPSSSKDNPSRNVSVPNSEARLAQVPPRTKESQSTTGRKAPHSGEERKPVFKGSQMQANGGPHKLASTSKPKLTSVDSRKNLGTNNGNGPGRPLGPNGVPYKRLTGPTEKKSSMPAVRKPLPSKLQSSKQPLEQKRVSQESRKAKMVSKQLVSSAKPQFKQPPAKIPPRVTSQENRPKKRPVRQLEDDDNAKAFSMLRGMFGYNPRNYQDEDSDSDMEANFEDILKEEKISGRIARMEDEEEQRKIEEEERRERMRKNRKQSR